MEVPTVENCSIFPLDDSAAYKFYQMQLSNFWFPGELKFTDDIDDYNRLDEKVKNLIDGVLKFFIFGDKLVIDNINNNFASEFSSNCVSMFFSIQSSIENIHAETYNLMALSFKGVDGLNTMFENLSMNKVVMAKYDFTKKWMNKDEPLWKRLLAFICVEGIFFCSLFAIPYWLRSQPDKYGMRTFVRANCFIANDELLHRNFGIHLLKKNLEKIKLNIYDYEFESTFIEILMEAKSIEFAFIDDILPESFEDINANDLKDYVKCIIDDISFLITKNAIFNSSIPTVEWMRQIDREQKNNFYEITVSDYSRFSVDEAIDWKTRTGITKKEKIDIYNNPASIDF